MKKFTHNQVVFESQDLHKQTDEEFWGGITKINELAETMKENGDRFGLRMELRDPRDNRRKTIESIILKPFPKKTS